MNEKTYERKKTVNNPMNGTQTDKQKDIVNKNDG